MHSAWIGEHHFDSLGVLSCPDLVLAYVAARTKNIRLAPAVTVLPLHHPIRVAEQWATLDLLSAAAASISPPAAATTGANTFRSMCRSTTTRASSKRAWRSCASCGRRTGRISHHGKHYSFDDMRITPKPVQKPMPDLCRIVLEAVDRTRRAARLRADRRAVRRRDELRRAASRWPISITRPAPSTASKPGRLMCSYFTHFADNKPSRKTPQRARQIRYYKECVIPAFPGDPTTAPPSYRYFIDMVERLHKVQGRRT